MLLPWTQASGDPGDTPSCMRCVCWSAPCSVVACPMRRVPSMRRLRSPPTRRGACGAACRWPTWRRCPAGSAWGRGLGARRAVCNRASMRSFGLARIGCRWTVWCVEPRSERGMPRCGTWAGTSARRRIVDCNCITMPWLLCRSPHPRGDGWDGARITPVNLRAACPRTCNCHTYARCACAASVGRPAWIVASDWRAHAA